MTAPLGDDVVIDDTAPPAQPPSPPGPAQTYGDPSYPSLLEQDDQTILDQLLNWFKEGRLAFSRHIAECEVNRRRRHFNEGNIWAVQKRQEVNQWTVYEPPGGGSVPASLFNKSDRLCSRLTSYLYADEWEPEADAGTGSDEDRAAAEFATRMLKDLQSESGTNELELHKTAFDLYGSSYRSGYIHYYVNPTGGGRQPLRVDAHPLAQHIDQAETDPLGNPVPQQELTPKYVGSDGSLAPTPDQAALRWVPKLQAEVLRSDQVFPLPFTQPVPQADAALIVGYWPYRTLVARLPSLRDQPEDVREAITKYKAPQADYLLPRKAGTNRADKTEPKALEDRVVWCMMFYARECPLYEDGAWIVTLGDKLVLVKEPWIQTEPTRSAMDIPVTQVRQLRGEPSNPHGSGLMDAFGPANEARIQLLGQVSDMIDRGLNRKTFAPIHSIQQVREGSMGFGSVVPINPGGNPTWEDVPDPPRAAWEFFDRTTQEMNDESGLQDAGQGLQTSNVNSGRQALAVVSQVHAGLTDMNQFKNAAYIRSCRIELQLVKKFYTVPQRVAWVGEDGAYKERYWMGSDLGSTKDVKLKPGTGTMIPPMQKAELAVSWAAQGILDKDTVRDVAVGTLSAWTGVQDNPHVLRIRQQIAQWKDGPPQGWAPPQAPMMPAPLPPSPPFGPPLGPPSAAGGPAAPPMGPPPMVPAGPPPPDPASPFDPRPVDQTPAVAQLRLAELLKACSSQAYGQKPPPWRALIDGEVQRMQTAMMPPPTPMGPPGGPPPPQAGGPPGPSPTPPPLNGPEAAVLGPQA